MATIQQMFLWTSPSSWLPSWAVADYKFISDLVDSIGWFNLTGVNSPSLTSTGVDLWASNTNKTARLTSELPFGLTLNQAMTIAIKFKMNTSSWFQALVTLRQSFSGTDCSTFGIFVNTTSNLAYFTGALRAGNALPSTSFTPWTTNDHTLVVSYAGWWATANFKWYIDWTLVINQSQTSGTISVGNREFAIGSNSGLQFASTITRRSVVWNRQLSDSEVSSLSL